MRIVFLHGDPVDVQELVVRTPLQGEGELQGGNRGVPVRFRTLQ